MVHSYADGYVDVSVVFGVALPCVAVADSCCAHVFGFDEYPVVGEVPFRAVCDEDAGGDVGSVVRPVIFQDWQFSEVKLSLLKRAIINSDGFYWVVQCCYEFFLYLLPVHAEDGAEVVAGADV